MKKWRFFTSENDLFESDFAVAKSLFVILHKNRSEKVVITPVFEKPIANNL